MHYFVIIGIYKSMLMINDTAFRLFVKCENGFCIVITYETI